MNWKLVGGVTAGLFGAGIAVGYAAQKRGIPQDQVARWLLKGVVRRALRMGDIARDMLPSTEPQLLAEALIASPPRPEVE